MMINCPNCQSERIVTKDLSKKTCGAIGVVGGAATGGMAGAKLGEVIDDRILDNYQCLACDYAFSRNTD